MQGMIIRKLYMRKPEEAKILSNEEYLDLKKRIAAGDEQAFNILKDKTTHIMCQHFLVDDFVSRYKHLSKDDMAYYICELINHNFNNVVKTKGLLPTASKHLIRCKQNCYYLFQRKNDDRELAIQDAPHIELVSFEALQANELDSINADDEVEDSLKFYEDSDQLDRVESYVDERFISELIHSAIDRLDPQYREIVIGYYGINGQQMTIRQLSKKLDLSIEGVRYCLKISLDQIKIFLLNSESKKLGLEKLERRFKPEMIEYILHNLGIYGYKESNKKYMREHGYSARWLKIIRDLVRDDYLLNTDPETSIISGYVGTKD